MSNDLMLIFLIALALFLMQSIGGWFQIRDYKKAVQRMRQLGSVGIGQKRGTFLNGNLVLIACDTNGVITGVEVMQGLTFLAHFKPCDTLLGQRMTGQHIDHFSELFSGFDKKQRKRYKGYVQAIDALQLRFHQPEDAQAVSGGTTEVVSGGATDCN